MGQIQVKYKAQRGGGTDETGGQMVKEIMSTKEGHTAFMKVYEGLTDQEKQAI